MSTMVPRNDKPKGQPHLRKMAIFTSPANGGSHISIHFNDQVTGRVRKTIENPERLIMLYDGAGE